MIIFFCLPLTGNLNLMSNIVGTRLSPYGPWKVEKNNRSLCVYGLFGGKKDEEKSDDAPSKVELLSAI